MKWLALAMLLAAGAAEAQERLFSPRLWLRAFSHDASTLIVEPQSGFWPEGMWLEVGLDGGVTELPPPAGCLWTSMAIDPRQGRRAAAAFCPARACDDARAQLRIEGEITWAARSSHLTDLVWSADGEIVAGVLSAHQSTRTFSLGNLDGSNKCLRAPMDVVEFGQGEPVSDLPANLPHASSGLRLKGHDGARWLAEIGYSRSDAFVSHPAIGAMLERYCADNAAPEFGRPCGAPVGEILVRLDGDRIEAVMLGGGPMTARTLIGPEAAFVLSETCVIERLSRRRIKSSCDLARWDAPYSSKRALTEGGAVQGGLALSGDGRMIAALNPFAGAESSLTLIDAETGHARDVPISDWVREAFRATGRVSQVGDEE